MLKDVAEDIGMHESTISRATANKYAHTPQGIFELKFFFTSGVKAGRRRGRQRGDRQGKDPRDGDRAKVPMIRSPTRLSPSILRRDNINIARRTVAKYRQALGILPSASRKRVG